jgi:hypothetical protein
LLEHEDSDLKEVIKFQKRKKQCKKPLKDYLFDIDDPSAAKVFRPGKIAQARIKKLKWKSRSENRSNKRKSRDKNDRGRLK